jgi:hypothetical protein
MVKETVSKVGRFHWIVTNDISTVRKYQPASNEKGRFRSEAECVPGLQAREDGLHKGTQKECKKETPEV